MTKIPSHLYRYYSFPKEDKEEWISRIFTHQEIYYSCPLDFNDPFDCRIPINLEGTQTEYENYVLKLIHEFHSNLNRKERKIKKIQLTKQLQDKSYRDRFANEEATKFSKTIAMLCLSAEKDNILMYSHYANNHTGFCLEFKTSENFHALKVEYPPSRDFPKIYLVKPSFRDQLGKLLLIKSIDWAYEKEWRLIEGKKHLKKQKGNFKKTALTGVIFGCEMLDSNKSKIKDWLKRGETNHVKLYQAEKESGKFSLKIQPI